MFAESIEIWEYLLVPFYLAAFLLFGQTISNSKYRSIFTLAVLAKFIGSIGFISVYLFYYGGGDTIAYYTSAIPFSNLISDSPIDGFRILFSSFSIENYSHFTKETGYPINYIYASRDTFSVIRVLVPIMFFTFRSYILTSLTLSMLSLIAQWKLFMLFEKFLPNFTYQNAFCFLIFPSTLFWGGGISKDTITFAATCYFVYGFYNLLIKRNFNFGVLFLTLLSIYLIIQIKTYIFLGILPGALLWLFSRQIRFIPNKFIRISFIPIIFILSSLLFAFIIAQLGETLGDYSPDNLLDKAITSQEDLRQDYYGGNSFDIGKTDPTLVGVLTKFPMATFYGFFGPTLLQVRNIVSLFSALENTYMLALTILILVRVSPLTTFYKVLDNPILIFCLIFSILFAFALGFSTSNFGALVRFKIPMLPFFNFFLLVVYNKRFTFG